MLFAKFFSSEPRLRLSSFACCTCCAVLLGFLETRSARPISLAAANLNRETIVWSIKTRGPAYVLLCPIPWIFNHDDASDETRSARPIALAAVNLTRGTIVWSIKLAAPADFALPNSLDFQPRCCKRSFGQWRLCLTSIIVGRLNPFLVGDRILVGPSDAA